MLQGSQWTTQMMWNIQRKRTIILSKLSDMSFFLSLYTTVQKFGVGKVFFKEMNTVI